MLGRYQPAREPTPPAWPKTAVPGIEHDQDPRHPVAAAAELAFVKNAVTVRVQIARIDVPHIPDAVAVAVGLVPVEEDAPVDVSADPVALCVVVRVAASPVAEVWGVGGGG